MLNLDSSVQSEELTLFRDYNDAQLYWYMPNSPRLARENGEPLFQLLLYRRDVTDNVALAADDERGGGFLTMTVDLGVSQATLAAVSASLSAGAGGSVRLAPVPFESGRVRVTSLGVSGGSAAGFESVGPGDDDSGSGDAPGFVERVLGFASPSLYGENRAVFSMELSTEGAQLMRASLENDGASAIAVLYELDYVGLKPAREVTITIDYRQSYSHYRSTITSNTLWFKANIDAETERLEQSGAISIEDVNYLELEPDELAARQTELLTLAKELAQWTFFRPALRPGEVLAVDRGSVTVYDPTADASTQTAGFTTPLDSLEGGRNREGDGPVVNPASTTRSGGVRATGTAETAGTTGDATPGGETAAGTAGSGTSGAGGSQPGALDSSSAVARWNRAGRPQAAYVMRSLDQNEEQHIEYKMTQVSAHRRTAAPQGSIRLLAGDSDLAGRIRSVDLNDPFFERITGSVTTSADLAAVGVSSLVVALRYGVRPDGSGPKDTAEFVLSATGERHEYEFNLDHLLTLDIEYRVTAHLVSGFAIGSDSSSIVGAWEKTSTRHLDINPSSLGALLPVRLVAGQIDWDAVEQVQVEIGYRDPPNDIDTARIVTLSQTVPEAFVPIRVADRDATQFTATASYFYEGNQETVEQVVNRRVQVVLNQPPSKAVPVSVSARDPLSRLAKVTVELQYQPETGIEQRKLLSLTGGETQSWSFFRSNASDPARYNFKTTLFGKSGTTEQLDWNSTTERQLIVGDTFPAILEVEVQIIGSMADAGVLLARLVLDYPGAPPGTDHRTEVALRGSPDPVRWSVPSATRELSPYEWQIEWVRGPSDIVTASGTSQDELLFLFVPEVS